MEVTFLGRAASYDGTLSGILAKLRKNVTCELSVPNQTLANADHDIAIAYENGDPIGVIAYNAKKNRVNLFCAKTDEVGEKLRIALGKRNPKVKEYLLGTPTFTSPPAYTSDPVMDYERQIRGEFKLTRAAVDEGQERSTDFKKDKKEYKSTFGVKGNIGGRLKTRKRVNRKQSNGSARLRRHRSRRMSKR